MEVRKTASKTYRWQGHDPHGHLRSGLVSAERASQAMAQLHSRGMRVQRLERAWFAGLLTPRRLPRPATITLATRQLAALLEAGLPMDRALEILAASGSQEQNRLWHQLHDELHLHGKLSSALASQPRLFDPLYLGLVAAGEQAGNLGTMLRQVARWRESVAQRRQIIGRALRYPMLVAVGGALLTLLLVVGITPRFAAAYASFDTPLPAATQLLIRCSDWLLEHGPWLLAMALTLPGVRLAIHRYLPALSHWLERRKLKLPWWGSLLTSLARARMASTLGTLVGAGLPLGQVLELGQHSEESPACRAALTTVAAEVAQGVPLGDAVARQPLLGGLMAQMVRTGVESACLDKMLLAAAAYYEEECGRRVELVAAIAEPLAMTCTGVLVGLLMIALYLPIFQLGNLY